MTVDINHEKELLDPVKLCNPDGSLNPDAIGWSRRHIFDCNLSGRCLRKKKWNYWAFTNDDCLFSVTVSDLDYAGMVFMYYYDFHTHAFIEKTYITPLGRGCLLPQTVDQNVRFSHPKVNIEMCMDNGCMNITVTSKDFGGNTLSADLQVIYPENYETLNVVIPWNNKTFQFTSKHEGMSVSGALQVGSKGYRLEPETSFACLDYGRGIWPRKIDWNWANVSGMAEGRRIGINLGARWTDNTGMTENAIVIDGRLEKISEDVLFEFDNNDYMKEWTIRSKFTDKICLTFHPKYERIARSNALLVRSELHQMIGTVTGTIRPDGASHPIELTHLIGCAEDHHTVW